MFFGMRAPFVVHGRDMKSIVKSGIDSARQDFVDGGNIYHLELDIQFWLKVDACDLCTDTQMCSGHYDKFFNGTA